MAANFLYLLEEKGVAKDVIEKLQSVGITTMSRLALWVDTRETSSALQIFENTEPRWSKEVSFGVCKTPTISSVSDDKWFRPRTIKEDSDKITNMFSQEDLVGRSSSY